MKSRRIDIRVEQELYNDLKELALLLHQTLTKTCTQFLESATPMLQQLKFELQDKKVLYKIKIKHEVNLKK